MPPHHPVLVPKAELEDLVSQVDLLMAMYPSEDELTIDDATRHHIDTLRDWCADDRMEDKPLNGIPSTLSLQITVSLDIDDQDSKPTQPQNIQLSIDVPVRVDSLPEASSTQTTSLKVRLRQPSWLTKTQTAQLNASLPDDNTTDILATIDYFRDTATQHLLTSQALPTSDSFTTILPPSAQTSLVRVWFYFPSLSTRSKRSDLVTYAPIYSLSGFVLAGKPGILCLEGTSVDIDAYMKFIKTESWGDIPSHHKKVSERYREVLTGEGKGRVFEGMCEITDATFMGEKRGERGNRGDLRALEGWLDGLGLRGVFEKVLL